MTLDRYMDDFGRDLARATRTRRRRRRAPLALAFPAAGALAIAAVLLTDAGGGVDAIAEAREALAPKGEIVHMVMRASFGPRLSGPMEQWYAADPARWRVVQQLGKQGSRFEMAYSRKRIRVHDTRRDIVRIWPAPQGPGFTAPGILGGDPTTELRSLLAGGDVRDDGVVTVDGRSVRRLVSEPKDGKLRRRLVYYMDPQTFAPIGGRLYMTTRGRMASVVEFHVDHYERLPLNAETEPLLRIQKSPDTRFVWQL